MYYNKLRDVYENLKEFFQKTFLFLQFFPEIKKFFLNFSFKCKENTSISMYYNKLQVLCLKEKFF